MKLAINLSFLRPAVGGSMVYTHSIVRALAERSDVSLSVFGAEQIPTSLDSCGVSLLRVPGYRLSRRLGHQPARLWTELIGCRTMHDLRSVDAVWSPGGTTASLPPRTRSEQIVTIHDLLHLSAHSPLGTIGRERRSWAVRRAVRDASLIAVPSKLTAAAVVERLGVDPGRVVATGEGVDLTVRRSVDFQLPEKFLICPSTDHAHKNHRLLFDGLTRAGINDSEMSLVLTGWRYSPPGTLAATARSCGIQRDRIIDLGYVEDHGLVLDAMALSAGVVLPSVFEGWGLPALEASALGRPVLSHEVGGVPEFRGGGLRTPDFNSAADWANHLRLLLDEDSEWQSAAAADAERVASAFGWQSVAARLVGAFTRSH